MTVRDALTKPETLELPFDQFQRYELARRLVESTRTKGRHRILDVGDFSSRLSAFLPNDDVMAVDHVKGAAPDFVIGEALNLPFRAASFDYVTCVDVLEHIEGAKRQAFIAELLRISNDVVILAAPVRDERVEASEKLVYDQYLSSLGFDHPYLREHIELGLPALQDIIEVIKASGHNYQVLPNGYLNRWTLMMLVLPLIRQLDSADETQDWANRLYNSFFYSADNSRPSYRSIVFVSKTGTKSIEAQREKFSAPATDDDKPGVSGDWPAVFGLASELLGKASSLRRKSAELEQTCSALQQRCSELEQVAEDLGAQLRAAESYAAGREAILQRYHNWFPFRVYFRLKAFALRLSIIKIKG